MVRIDANSHVTQFRYDNRGRRTQRILPEGQVETVAYDAVGNVTNKVDFNGKLTTFTYDPMNRLLSKVRDPSFNAPSVSWTYDLRGLRTTMTDAHGLTTYQYDSRGRRTQKATPLGTLDYTYDLQGNLKSTTSDNVNGTDLTYTYDALNRLKTVLNPSTGMTMYNYDQVGNLQDFIYPNGVSHAYEYDSLNRLTNQVLALVGTPFESYAYKLAPTGHRLQVREGNGRLVNYQYDNIYRLTKESILFSSIVGDIDYGLDPVGNRLNMNSTVLGIPSQVNTFDDNDRLDSDTYDANGNTVAAAVPGGTATDTYDFENRLTNRVVGADTISIVYDGDGNRVTKTVNGVTTQYLVDDNNLTGFAQVFEELDSGLSVDVVYTYGHDLISQERAGPTNFVAHFYGYDGHGNVRLLTDSAGIITDRYDYDAFGNLIASSGTTLNNYLYTGEQFDPDLGLYFLRARYMDTTRGRFWTMDGFEGLNQDPISLHKYLYANADPVNLTDPSGNTSLIEILIGKALELILGQTIERGGRRSVRESERVAAVASIAGIQKALDIYEVDNGMYPTTKQGLFALRFKPELKPIPRNWNGPYLREALLPLTKSGLPADPWGNAYKYFYDPTARNFPYVYSVGPDGKDGTPDDVGERPPGT